MVRFVFLEYYHIEVGVGTRVRNTIKKVNVMKTYTIIKTEVTVIIECLNIYRQ